MPALFGNVAWLIPDQPEHKIYTQVIDEAAKRFRTSVFPPHITFGSLPDLPIKQLSLKMDNVFADKETIEFSADFIRCSTSPYQNLVHQYKMNTLFKSLSNSAMKKLSGFQPKEEIHLSLMYGKVDCTTLEELSVNLKNRLPQKVRIAEYQIIQLAGRVEQWEILHRQSLTKGK